MAGQPISTAGRTIGGPTRLGACAMVCPVILIPNCRIRLASTGVRGEVGPEVDEVLEVRVWGLVRRRRKVAAGGVMLI